MGLRVLISMVVLAVAATAEANVTSEFVGWSADGTYYVERKLDDNLKQYRGGDFVSVPYYLFVPAREGVRPTWPAKIAPYPKRDERHAIVDLEKLGADDAAARAAVAALVKAPAPSKTGPGGISLTVEQRGDDILHVIDLKGRTLPMRPASEGYTIRNVYWREDGGAVAILARRTDRDGTFDYVFAYDLARYLVPGGDRKTAVKLRKEAARAAKRKDWHGALVELQEAVNVDPSYVEAQYDLAAAASRRADVGTAKRALAALAASKDPAAARALRKAATDPAFDRAATRDELRTLLGLPAYATLTPEQQLTGTWTSEGAGCGDPWLTLTLAKKGKATLRVRSACVPEHAREWDRTRTFKGTWTLDGTTARVRLALRPSSDVPDLRDVTAEVRPCPDARCLFVARGDTTFAPFHRGEPE